MAPSNENKRGVNPTHTEPQPDTAGGKDHKGGTAHGETHPPTLAKPLAGPLAVPLVVPLVI